MFLKVYSRFHKFPEMSKYLQNVFFFCQVLYIHYNDVFTQINIKFSESKDLLKGMVFALDYIFFYLPANTDKVKF